MNSDLEMLRRVYRSASISDAEIALLLLDGVNFSGELKVIGSFPITLSITKMASLATRFWHNPGVHVACRRLPPRVGERRLFGTGRDKSTRRFEGIVLQLAPCCDEPEGVFPQ